MFFFVPDGYSKKDVVDIFNSMILPHGITFDNGKRWCANCNHLQSFDRLLCDDGWLNKACSFCHAIWPEYVVEYEETDDQETAIFLEEYQSARRN